MNTTVAYRGARFHWDADAKLIMGRHIPTPTFNEHHDPHSGKFAPTDGDLFLPPAPGTVPIPDGDVRLYHQTSEAKLADIAKEGILLSKARGIEGPLAIYADEKGFYGNPEDKPTVEFHVSKERWDPPFVRTDSVLDQGRVAPENIIAIHYPWHRHARYIEKHPDVLKAVVAGEHDSLLTGHGEDYRQSILYIKQRYGGHVPKPTFNPHHDPHTGKFDWGSSAQIVYHGTRTPDFEHFRLPDPANEIMLDRALGVHVAKDPEVANSRLSMDAISTPSDAKQTGPGIFQLKIPSDDKFYQIYQPLLDDSIDPSTPKTSRNVYTDEVQIGNDIFRTAWQKDPQMFGRYLDRRWNMGNHDEAQKLADSILSGKPTNNPVSQSPINGLEGYIKSEGVISGIMVKPEDRVKAVKLYKDELQSKGYVGIKYINTSPMETEHAKDPTSYVVFDPKKYIRSVQTEAFMGRRKHPVPTFNPHHDVHGKFATTDETKPVDQKPEIPFKPADPQIVRAIADEFAKKEGIDPQQIIVKTTGAEKFDLNGKDATEAGHTSGRIVTLFADQIDASRVKAVLVHELEHVKLGEVLDAAIKEQDAAKALGHPVKFSSTGSLEAPYDKQFPIINKLNQTMFQHAPVAFAISDGVSSYSAQYWMKWATDQMRGEKGDPFTAMHETLAEMARIKDETGALPQPSKRFGVAGAPDDVRRDSIKIWNDLYESVDSLYDAARKYNDQHPSKEEA